MAMQNKLKHIFAIRRKSKFCINLEQPRYQLISDNVFNLHIKDIHTGKMLIKTPQEILSSNYLQYSKSDIAKVGYICGQLASVRPD